MAEQPRRPHFIRVDLDDPATRRRLIRNGAVWRFAQYWQLAINAIERGEVPLDECQNMPPEVKAFLTPSR